MDKVLPDLIVCWPRHMDFPLWRTQLHRDRDRFSKVLVVFTDMNVAGLDYREFIKDAMKEDDVMFLDNDPVSGDQDWRNVATNKALLYSDSEWVFFTEQDFFWNQGFWNEVFKKDNEYKVVKVGDRVHPCCIIIKRSLLDNTCLDFSVIRDVSDHFSRIQNDLSHLFVQVIPEKFWIHMGGLSQNLRFLQLGTFQDIAYNKEEFRNFCIGSLPNAHPDFKAWFNEYLET